MAKENQAPYQKNEVLPPSGQVPAPASAPFDYGADAGSGFENTTQKDLSVPFILVLQTNSPQCDGPTALPAARPGMLYNSVTGELYPAAKEGDPGLVLQPCYKEYLYTEWLPRKEGGGGGRGFVGVHAPDSEVVKAAIADAEGRQFGKLETPGGDGKVHDLVETHTTFCLLLSPDGREVQGFGVVGFSSTKIKPGRDWHTSMYLLRVGGQRPPLFANRGRLLTIQQENQHGKYYNFRIVPAIGDSWASSLIHPVNERRLLEEGRDFAKMAREGLARANFESAAAAGTDPAGEAGRPGGGAGAPEGDGKVPF